MQPTNTNGNGSPPTNDPAEDSREDFARKLAFQVRRDVRRDRRLSAGAKFLFYCILDDCFWHKVGGYGIGRIFAAVKTLAERYCHDEETISRWRDELIECEWLYCSKEWPFSEWRLTPLLPAPEVSSHQRAIQMSLGQPDADAATQTRKMPVSPSAEGKPEVSGGKQASTGVANPEDASRAPASSGSRTRKMPVAHPEVAGHSTRKMPVRGPQDASARPAKGGKGKPEHAGTRPARAGLTPAIHARPLGSNGHREKTPGDRRSEALGEREGTPPHPEMVRWENKWWFDSKLRGQLKLLDEGIAESQPGPARKRLKDRRHSLRVALGVAVPHEPPAPAPVASKVGKLPPKDVWTAGVNKLREAVR